MPPSNAQLQKQIDELKVRMDAVERRTTTLEEEVIDLDARVTKLEEEVPPDPPAQYGPRKEPLPPEAIPINPGDNIQTITDAYPAGSLFGLRAGLYPLTNWITPKSGNRYIGEYGAILDGRNWVTADSSAGAFRGHNATITDVLIRNLTFNEMPQKGVQAYKDFCARWTVEYCAISDCIVGVNLPPQAILRGCDIHHCVGVPNDPDPGKRGGGYGLYFAHGSVMENNRIADCGPEQKSINATRLTWRNNLVQRCPNGIWLDGDGTGSLIEGNTVEDGQIGIFPEACVDVIVRGNVVRRSQWNGIFISTTRNSLVTDNLFEACKSALVTFIEPAVVGKYTWDPDLRDNVIEHNIVKVPTGGLGALFSYSGSATPEQLEPYLSNAKNNVWKANEYAVPDVSGWWWNWVNAKTWAQWQAQGQDAGGRVIQGGA